MEGPRNATWYHYFTPYFYTSPNHKRLHDPELRQNVNDLMKFVILLHLIQPKAECSLLKKRGEGLLLFCFLFNDNNGKKTLKIERGDEQLLV